MIALPLRALALLAAAATGLATAAPPPFRAAAFKVDITPDTPQMLRGYNPRMSTGVHDRLYHRILVLDDGATSFFLISSDLCSLSPAFCDRVTGALARDLGVPAANVWWCMTHTHSSPYVGSPGIPALFMPKRFEFPLDESYTDLVTRKLAEGARQAREKLEPARLAVGWGYAQANINRRARDTEGKVRLGMNPDGPVDRRIGLIRLDRAGGGAPLALVANYAMHATVLGGHSTVVSADAPGVVAEYVEGRIGAPMLYVNGAAGNVAPLHSTRTEAEAKLLDHFKVLLGDPILDAAQRLRPTSDEVRLRPSRIILETPKRPGLGWSDELKAYLRVSADGAQTLLVPLRFLQLTAGAVLWSAPMELFCDVAQDIRDRSPFPDTLYFGYTNGTFAYLPGEREFLAGGYEPATSPFTASAAGHLAAAVQRHLRQLHAAP